MKNIPLKYHQDLKSWPFIEAFKIILSLVCQKLEACQINKPIFFSEREVSAI